ncbi:hypothetical protein NGB36_21595 [Streptomyces sp. RB6PN25]|uniref:Uncharacterized protein n=1 Tax=Streptomyces humicola TaxID=2953240 RepID=A0ABT1PZM2_9ACTN|nr:hypothetical protein [Streptomyces humicola]MCQ4083130.1 hypothetical protein [Streptomyces humicola]
MRNFVRMPWQWTAGVALAVVALAAAVIAVIAVFAHVRAPQEAAGPGSGALSTPTVTSQDVDRAAYAHGCVTERDGIASCFVWDQNGAQAYADPSKRKRIGLLRYGVQPFSCQTRGETAAKADVANRRYYSSWWLRYAGPSATAWVNAVEILGGWDHGKVPHLEQC